jgi:transcriptional regulator with XRE-family HTH domain
LYKEVAVGTHPKPAERELARQLRREQGLTVREIAARVGVSLGSVSLWTRDIDLTSDQLAERLISAAKRRAESCSETARRKRRGYQQAGRDRASLREPLHLAGCMLYWAEGSKSKNAAVLSNSDVNMVVFFRRFLSECFGIPAERFRVRLNVYLNNGLSLTEIENHWLEALDLPRSCLRGHSLNHFPTSSSGKKRHKLPFGVCTLTVGSTPIVQHIYGAIQEYGGFEEPRWLG